VLLPVGSDELEVVALAKTIEMAVSIGFRQKIGAGVAGRAAETRATYLANDVSQDPYYFDPQGRAHGSALALPLLREGRLLGVLYLETDQPEAFSPADVVAHETLAQHVTTALQNARLYAAARDRLRDVLALQSVSEAVVASLELDRIIADVVALLRDTIGYRYVSLYILDGDVLRLKAQVGYPDELIIPTIPISRGVSGRAVRTRQTQFIPDVTADPDFLQAHYEVRSEICVPLLKDDMVLGTLNIESDPNHRLTPDDVGLLNALAGQVTVALINARLFEAEREQRALNEVLREASVTVSASLDFETVLDRLLTQLERVVPYDVACVMLFDAGQAWVARQRGYDQFGPAAVAAIGAATWDVAATPNLARLVGTGQTVIIADTAADPHWRFLPDVPNLCAWIGTPAIAQGEVLASFLLGKDRPNFYTDIHATRLQIFASQSALALQNARLFAAQQRRSEEQRLLLSAARDLSVGLSQDAVLAATARHMTTALHSAACAVSIWERDLDRVVTLFDYSSHTDDDVDVVGSFYYLRDYPTTRRVLEERLAVITRVNDPSADPAEADLLRRFGHAAGLMVPLFTGDHVLGLIEVQRDAGDPPFTDADLQLAQSLAAQAAVALENARLHAAVHENLRERDALLEASSALLSTLDLSLLLQNILAAALTAIPRAEKGTIILADDAQPRLRVAAAHGYADPRVAGLEFGFDQGYTGLALRGNRPLLINDVAAGPMILPLGEIPEMDHIRSAMVAPLTPKGVAGAPLGAISLDSTALAAFTPGDLRVLETFANTAAIAIDNARLHAEVSRLAVTDSLTNLANPRAFEQALAVECHRAGRYGYALSLIIMDIDNFKHYNDTYGHPAGNERLKAIADILRANVRDPDLPVRYGGEEFALLLPHTNKAGALALAERIREAAELGAPHDLPRGAPLPGYSLSLGVASFPIDALTADQLLVAADNAELAAKRGGKNRVVAAPPLAPEFGAA
jgi:diguanylate cyclase (GGDEF)-like protein